MNRAAARFLALLWLVLVAGCKRHADEPRGLDLVFTAQTHGRLTPCGCFSGQYGGVSRLKTALSTMALTNAVGLDAGDALEGTEDFHRMRHRRLSEAFAGMGFAAMNVGHAEASLDVAGLRALAAASAVPMVGANVLDRATGKPVVAPWRILERGGLRVAIVGVCDPRGFDDGPGDGIVVERMETCLGRVLPEARRGADLVVLLAHTDEATLAALAREFYEIGVILGGRVSQPSQSLVRENHSLLYHTGNEGKSFGALRLSVPATGDVGVRQSAMTLLTDTFREDPGVLALAATYRREVRGARLSIDDPARAQEGRVPGTGPTNLFAGSASCLGCHAAAAKVWGASGHAHAFEALVRRDSDADPSCIRCHTVGFGTTGGYRRADGKSRLADVGCESCHGPGAVHVAQRQSGAAPTFRFRPLGAGDCRKCHQGEFSRPFDWDKFWPAVRH